METKLPHDHAAICWSILCQSGSLRLSIDAMQFVWSVDGSTETDLKDTEL